jgi:hypothetical protein
MEACMMEETNTNQGENMRGIIIGIFHGNIPDKRDKNGGKTTVETAFSKV